MNQDHVKKPESAMTQSELREERIFKFDRKNRFQWKGNLDFGSELKKDFSSTGPMRKDMNADPMRCSPGPLSERHSAQYRARCQEILDMKFSAQLKCAAFEEEYQPLPFPACCTLQTNWSLSRSKEGARVTFAQDCLDGYPLKKSSSCQTEALSSSAAERPGAWCFSTHPRRGHPQWGSLSRPEALTESPGRNVNVRTFQASSDLCPCRAPLQSPLIQPETAAPDPETELECNSSSLFKHTSDLYVRTHLPEEVSPFRNFLEVTHSPGSFHRSLLLDRLLDSQLPATRSLASRHSPPASPSGLERKDLQSLSSSLCTTVSAYHPLTAIKNNPTRDREDLGLREGVCLARTPPPSISELSSVLRQLLDLVDQHWRGPRSLQLNPRFLTHAYDLLAYRVSPSPAQCERGRSPWRRGVDKNGDKTERMKDSVTLGLDSPHLKHQKNQPTQTHQQMKCGSVAASFLPVYAPPASTSTIQESLKNRVATAMEERNSLHCQIVNSKPESVLNIFESGRQWDQCLERQVKALREQERHFKLEETMGLMQDSHRSLLSSNKSLMEQLNSQTSTQYTDTWKCVSHHDFRMAAPSSMDLTQEDNSSLTVL